MRTLTQFHSTSAKYRATAKFQIAKVDRDKGIIFGVSLIAKGPALGHGMLVDQATLESVLKAGQRYTSGVKIKFNPSTFDHGQGGIAGLIPKESLRIDGDKLIGDAHIEEHFDSRNYLLSLAEKQPDTFGFSIDFLNEPEEINGVRFARCTDLEAATIVDAPAANSSGLFAVTVAKSQPSQPSQLTEPQQDELDTMTKDELSTMLTEALRPLNDRMSKLEALSSEPPATTEEMAAAGCVDGDTHDNKMAKVRKFRADKAKPVTIGDIETIVQKAAVQAFKKVGGAPASGGGATVDPGQTTQGGDANDGFDKTVAAHFKANGGNLGLAMKRAASDNAKGYNTYMNALDKGGAAITVESLKKIAA